VVRGDPGPWRHRGGRDDSPPRGRPPCAGRARRHAPFWGRLSRLFGFLKVSPLVARSMAGLAHIGLPLSSALGRYHLMNPVSEYGRAIQESAGLLQKEAGRSRLEPETAERLRELLETVRVGIRDGHLQLPGDSAVAWPDVMESMSAQDQQALSQLLGSIDPLKAAKAPPMVFAVHSALQRFEGDRVLLREVLEIFVEQVPLILARMRHSAADENTGAVTGLAHELRGAAANVGAESLRAIAQQLECDLTAGRFEGICAGVDLLEEELGRLRVEAEAFAGGELQE